MRVALGDLTDWYVDGDESAALVGQQVIVLSALGTSIVEVLTQQSDESVEVDVIAAALQARFGQPSVGTAEEAARAAIDALIDAAIVRIAADSHQES